MVSKSRLCSSNLPPSASILLWSWLLLLLPPLTCFLFPPLPQLSLKLIQLFPPFPWLRKNFAQFILGLSQPSMPSETFMSLPSAAVDASTSVVTQFSTTITCPIGPFSTTFLFLQQPAIALYLTHPPSASIVPQQTYSPPTPHDHVSSTLLFVCSTTWLSYPSYSAHSTSSHSVAASSLPSTPMLLAPNITHLVFLKLDATNYILWKSQFIPVLISHDLLGYIDGTFPCPPQYISDSNGQVVVNLAYTAWVCTDQSLLSWINATLTKDILQEVHELTSSRDVWLTLECRFLDQSVAKELQLKLQLQSF
ncbi:hypothetical protein RJ640_026016 [Escallonia rubra]|uniref:Retrotransposon Copia-like N-terminal domain-containing protein n=1 Tax=Escallonia rubra TaxID=112253 RepID=A0AA88UEI4_9ASTE|nr:hypothetical protein RJ640_026016 [Escallonia rubra]